MDDAGISFAGAQFNRWESALVLYASYLMYFAPEPKPEMAARLIDKAIGVHDEPSLRRVLREVAGVAAEEIVEPVKTVLAARGKAVAC